MKVHVDGELDASGPNPDPSLTVTPYVNGDRVGLNNVFSALNPTPVVGSLVSIGYQTRAWYEPPGSASPLVVNTDVYFPINFTYGTPFNLGIYAYTDAGNNSINGSPTVTSTAAQFQNTIALDGIYEVLAGPAYTPVSDYTIVAVSGLDYRRSYVDTPEPATLVSLTIGGGVLGAMRRRRAKS